ncbi:type IV toxin-antitoxin system AbiEi family antitoxin domain-containing protein [Paludibaculum fermentans]|uniref:type IV toxin-antitoxin system AbiEi family antitoxin domain-containing protein n=1 Tax=Paludibaculum fermentans TaxID=1473598 RepID=UPI003EBB847E
MQRTSNRDLYQIAEAQGGYFTAKQAARLGYTASKRNYHVGTGNWVREHRGIYRLALFPSPPRPDLILWWLWSRGRSDSPQGVFSHHTALALHELTDVNPARIDLTVPPTFRKGSEIPPVLRLHFAVVVATDIEVVENVPVTTALRTILDVWREQSLQESSLRDAFRDARSLGKITMGQIAQARKNPGAAQIIDSLERSHQ